MLYPLTDYKPRKSENLERGYLQGRYGAIPFLGKFAWANEEPVMTKRRDRDRKPARRSPFLAPKPRLLIVCEGKVTEPQYFRGYANTCENPRVTLEIAPEAGVPLTVVTIARDRKKGAERKQRKRKTTISITIRYGRFLMSITIQIFLRRSKWRVTMLSSWRSLTLHLSCGCYSTSGTTQE